MTDNKDKEQLNVTWDDFSGGWTIVRLSASFTMRVMAIVKVV